MRPATAFVAGVAATWAFTRWGIDHAKRKGWVTIQLGPTPPPRWQKGRDRAGRPSE